MTDEARLAAVHRDLVEWGILEVGVAPAITRRFRGAMMRAAARLQQEEQAGRAPAGNAVENAVALALAEYPLPPGAVAGPGHKAFLVAVEVASLPDAVRRFLGV